MRDYNEFTVSDTASGYPRALGDAARGKLKPRWRLIPPARLISDRATGAIVSRERIK